jgi:hypothetical protein
VNSYTVTYTLPGSSAPATPLAVQADEFMVTAGFVSFIRNDPQNGPTAVCAVPVALNPIIQQTAP